MLAWAGAAQAQPQDNRVYAVRDGVAQVPLPDFPGAEWRLLGEDGAVLRDFAPLPDNGLLVPQGGWYRLERRDADGAVTRFGGRFAAGHVLLVTGQSQALGLFATGPAQFGAFPAGLDAPPAPRLGVVLEACDCTRERSRWQVGSDALGARIMLAELARLLGPVPVALVSAAAGGASAAELGDPATPAGERLALLAGQAAPLSATLILGHGTTDTFAGTPAETYHARLTRLVLVLRRYGRPGMPVLLSELPPLSGGLRLLGSQKLGDQLLPDGPHWTQWLGLAGIGRLPAAQAQAAEAIRAAQRLAASRLGLASGGDLSFIEPGRDGLHWTAEGVAAAARISAAALAAAVTN